MKISKFGGSSVACASAIKNIINLAKDNDRQILVFSAIGATQKGDKKVTDLLIESYNEYNTSHNLDLKKVKEKFVNLKKLLGIKLNEDKEIDRIVKTFYVNLSRDFLVSRGEDLTA